MDCILLWIEAHPGLAAWMQAVFSVIAIGSAGWGSWWQVHKQNALRQEEQAAVDAKIRLVALAAIELGIESIDNAAEIAVNVPLYIYREGATARFREVINLISRVDMTRLTKDEMASAIELIKTCSLAISTVQTPIPGDDVMTRLHISGGLKGVLERLAHVKEPFADRVE